MQDRGPEEYLALAQQAEQAADKIAGDVAKQIWRAIAHEYRALAAEMLRQMQDEREHRQKP